MMGEETAVTVTHSDQEWRLALGILDHVSQLRQAEAEPLNVDKAIDLVKGVYAREGTVLSDELLQRAVRLALRPFPVPAPLSLPVASNGPAHGLDRVRQWFYKVGPETLTAIRPTPLDEANRMVQRLMAHRPLHTAQVEALLDARRAALSKAKQDWLRPKAWRALGAWCTLPVGMIGMAMTSVGTVPWSIWLAVLAGSFSVAGGLTASFFQQRGQAFQKQMEELGYAKTALAEGDLYNFFLNREMGIVHQVGQRDPTYYCALLSSDDAGQRQWEYATKAASEDPLLTEVWQRWLESDAPIRRGDADLLTHTAQAIQAAKKWLIERRQLDFPIQAQAHQRQQSLEALQARISTPPALLAP